MRTTAPYPGLASCKIQYHRQRRMPRESRSASRAGEIHLPSSSTSSTTVPFSSLNSSKLLSLVHGVRRWSSFPERCEIGHAPRASPPGATNGLQRVRVDVGSSECASRPAAPPTPLEPYSRLEPIQGSVQGQNMRRRNRLGLSYLFLWCRLTLPVPPPSGPWAEQRVENPSTLCHFKHP